MTLCSTPEGWRKDAITTLAHQWKTIQIPEGKDLSLHLDSGHTHYSPFIAEVESATAAVEDDAKQEFWGEITEPGNDVVRTEVVEVNPPQHMPAQAQDALAKTVPKARIIPNKVVMTTTGAQYGRWKQLPQRSSKPSLRPLGKNLLQDIGHATLQPRRSL